MTTRVVNINHNVSYDVYCGRAGHGQSGYFGNDHRIGYCSKCNLSHVRGEAVAAFNKDFSHRILVDVEYVRQILSLRGKVLGCFCAPNPCHATTISNWVDHVTCHSCTSLAEYASDFEGRVILSCRNCLEFMRTCMIVVALTTDY